MGDKLQQLGYDYETPSGYPYCGCDTCVTREMLFLVIALTMQGAKDGKVRITDV